MITKYHDYNVIYDNKLPEIILDEDENGDVIAIKGGTFSIKEQLKEKGMKWNSQRKRWEYATGCEDDEALIEAIEKLSSGLELAIAVDNDSELFEELGIASTIPSKAEKEVPKAVRAALDLKAKMNGCAEATQGAILAQFFHQEEADAETINSSLSQLEAALGIQSLRLSYKRTRYGIPSDVEGKIVELHNMMLDSPPHLRRQVTGIIISAGPVGPADPICSGCGHAHFTYDQISQIRETVKRRFGPCQILRTREEARRVRAKNGRGHWPHDRAVVLLKMPAKGFEDALYELRFVLHEQHPDAILSFNLSAYGIIEVEATC